MEQTEQFHFVTGSPLLTAKRPRYHSAQISTAGTCIGPMPLPDWQKADETWCCSFKDKKIMYGDARILPSGRMEGDSDLVGTGLVRQPQQRKDDDIEPVTYHGLHRHVIEELLHQVGPSKRLVAIIDLTPTEPTMAQVALEWGVPYLGVAFNDFHLGKLKKRLAQLVFLQFMNPRSSLHKAGLVAIMAGKPAPTPLLPPSSGPKPTPKPTPKPPKDESPQEAKDEEGDGGGEDPQPSKRRKKEGRKSKNDKSGLRAALLGEGDTDDDDEISIGEP